MVDPVPERGFSTGMPLVYVGELGPALGASPKFSQSRHQSLSRAQLLMRLIASS